jgi:hypothetical protein
MAVNKVVYGTTVLVDLTQDSITPESLVEGYTAHGANGAKISGTNPYVKAETDATVDEQSSLIAQIRTALNGKVAGGGEAADPVLQEKSVTPTKSAQTITPDSGYDGLSKVNVGAIPSQYIVPSGTKSVTENGTHDVNAYKSVSVNVPIPDGYIKPSGSLNITANGSYDVTDKAGVTVAVPENEPTLQEKTVTANGVVVPDSGYDGLSKVTVNVASSGGGSGSNELEVLTRKVTGYSNPTLTELGMYAFYGCNKLTSISLPSLTTAGTYAFMECTKLTEVAFPSLTAVVGSMFRRCLGLVKADFTNVTSIAAYGFYQCTHLETLILRGNSVCTLANTTTALNETLIAKGTTGYVYVPSALVESYKVATNWSTYAGRFRAIEDYPDICG